VVLGVVVLALLGGAAFGYQSSSNETAPPAIRTATATGTAPAPAPAPVPATS